MTEKTVSLVTFCCNIKYSFAFVNNTYRIKSKWDETFFFVSESELYSVMEDISDMTHEQFKEYAKERNENV